MGSHWGLVTPRAALTQESDRPSTDGNLCAASWGPRAGLANGPSSSGSEKGCSARFLSEMKRAWWTGE